MQRLKILAFGIVLAVTSLVPFVAAQPAMSATPAQATAPCTQRVITQADSGTTVTMIDGTCDQLRLDNGLSWSQPVVNGTSVKVVPAPSPVSTYQAWNIFAVGFGKSTITSLGHPICVPGQPCPQFVVLFQVTINVILPPAS